MKSIMLLTRPLDGKLSGRKMVLRTVFNVLSEISDVKVFYVSSSQDDLSKNKSNHNFLSLSRPSHIELLFNFITKVCLGSWSLNEALFFSKKSISIINENLKDVDVIYVDSVRMSTYLKFINVGTAVNIIDYDDIYSLRYKNLLKDLSGNIDILGFYKSNFPRFMNYFLKIFVRSLIKFESVRISKRELQIVNDFDYRVIVSSAEAKIMSHLSSTKFFAIPMSVPDYFASWNKLRENTSFGLSKSSKNKKIVVTLIGDFDYLPNKQSVFFIYEKIIPIFKENGISLVVNLIGNFSPDFQFKFDSSTIKFLGFVDDLKSSIDDSCCLLSPICSGSGIKTKIVESFSLGLPVVTNKKGIEGLHVEHRKNIMLAETPQDFFDCIMMLSENFELSKSISENAYQYFSLNFKFDVIRDKWLNIIGYNG